MKATAGVYASCEVAVVGEVAVSESANEAGEGAGPELEAAPTAVGSLLAASILDVDGGPLTGRDLLAAGIVAGRWQRLESELAEGLGLLAVDLVSKAEVTEQMRAFRLQRGLLSAEDMRAWMEPRGLSIGAVNAVAARVVARRRGGAGTAPPPDEVAGAIVAEAICTGALTEIGWWLADRMLSAKATAADITALALESVRVQRLVFSEACTIAGRASQEPGLLRAERIARITALDDAYRSWEASVTGDADLSRRLREHELDWCRYELEELRLTLPGAAAEVARQLAEGVDAREVAAAAGVPVAVHDVVLADGSAELIRALTGAVAREVAGPWEEAGEHVVVRVRERHLPDTADEQLVARARAELVDDAAARLRAGRVRWHDRA